MQQRADARAGKALALLNRPQQAVTAYIKAVALDADHIAALLRFRTEDHLEHAMEAQRRVWRLTGWLVIAMIVLFIVSIGLVARLMAVP